MKVVTLLALIACSSALTARAGSSLPQAFTQVLETRFTEVDVGGVTLTRKYDDRGQLVHLRSVDRNVRPPITEDLDISHTPEIWTRAVYHGQTLIRRSFEKYSVPGRLKEIESLWSSKEDGTLDRKTVTRYSDLQALIAEYQFEGGFWRLVSEVREPAIHGATTAEYTACLSKANKVGDVASCIQLLDSFPVPEKEIKDFTVASVENLTCKDGDELFLPNSFRIDLKSCSKPEAIDLIKRATNMAVGRQLSCLAKVNPKLATKMVESLIARRPMIKCAGARDRVGNSEFCEKPETGSACDKNIDRARVVSGAFFAPQQPSNVYLTSSDPMGYSATSVEDPELAEIAARKAKKADETDLASTIFHESLHSCAHHHHHKDTLSAPHHDDAPPNFGDAVYGCEALCGPSPQSLTREGCEACATAEGNLPTDQAKQKSSYYQDCKKFPSAEIVRQLFEGRWLSDQMAKCVGATTANKADACAALANMTKFSEICGKKSVTDESCLAAINIYAAKQVLAASRTKNSAAAFKYAGDAISKLPPFEVTGTGIDMPAKVTIEQPGLENFSRRKFASVLAIGFCERLHEKHPDLQVSVGEFQKTGAEFDYGKFPDAPKFIRIRNLNGATDIVSHYPIPDMAIDDAEVKEMKLSLDANMTAVNCERWLEMRKKGYYP